MREHGFLPGAFLIAAGVALGGWFIGHGFASARAADRFVTVKGVSEREVEADVALWPLRFVATDNVLTQAQARIDEDTGKVLAFLAHNGIPGSEASVQDLAVTDLLANPYRSGPTPSRFVVAKTLMVRSERPEIVAAASQRIGDLVQAGVVLSTEGRPGTGPTYLFTRLNDFKPTMIAEATAEAREAAQRFAADSGSRLGGIRRANQGVFQILPRDAAPGFSQESQLAKTLRVVTTVEYTLLD
jgi:hypothetical protein